MMSSALNAAPSLLSQVFKRSGGSTGQRKWAPAPSSRKKPTGDGEPDWVKREKGATIQEIRDLNEFGIDPFGSQKPGTGIGSTIPGDPNNPNSPNFGEWLSPQELHEALDKAMGIERDEQGFTAAERSPNAATEDGSLMSQIGEALAGYAHSTPQSDAQVAADWQAYLDEQGAQYGLSGKEDEGE